MKARRRSFQVVFSVVSSFVSLYQILNPKVLKFKIASVEQESDQFRLALDVKVRQLDLWHSSHVLFWNSKVELKFETKFLFCMCSCVWKKILRPYIFYYELCARSTHRFHFLTVWTLCPIITNAIHDPDLLQRNMQDRSKLITNKYCKARCYKIGLLTAPEPYSCVWLCLTVHSITSAHLNLTTPCTHCKSEKWI